MGHRTKHLLVDIQISYTSAMHIPVAPNLEGHAHSTAQDCQLFLNTEKWAVCTSSCSIWSAAFNNFSVFVVSVLSSASCYITISALRYNTVGLTAVTRFQALVALCYKETHSAMHCSSLTSHQLGIAQRSQALTAC